MARERASEAGDRAVGNGEEHDIGFRDRMLEAGRGTQAAPPANERARLGGPARPDDDLRGELAGDRGRERAGAQDRDPHGACKARQSASNSGGTGASKLIGCAVTGCSKASRNAWSARRVNAAIAARRTGSRIAFHGAFP